MTDRTKVPTEAYGFWKADADEHAALLAEMQRAAVPGYADEPPEERGWRDWVRDLLGRFM